jgi:hypothetical protein
MVAKLAQLWTRATCYYFYRHLVPLAVDEELPSISTMSYEKTPTFGRPVIHEAGRRRLSKQWMSVKHVTIRRSIGWKLVDSVCNLLHENFSFTLDGYSVKEAFIVHGNLPHRSPSDSIICFDLCCEKFSLIRLGNY